MVYWKDLSIHQLLFLRSALEFYRSKGACKEFCVDCSLTDVCLLDRKVREQIRAYPNISQYMLISHDEISLIKDCLQDIYDSFESDFMLLE